MVAGAVLEFSAQFPGTFIAFEGSNKQRTRLYQMAITLNLEELNTIYNIWGQTEQHGFERFVKGSVYYSFLILKK